MAELESVIVRDILKYLNDLPYCFAWKEHGGMYGTAGIPDIICCFRSRFVAFEVKRPGGGPTKLQEKTIRDIQNANGFAYVVTSLDEVKKIISKIEEIKNLTYSEGR